MIALVVTRFSDRHGMKNTIHQVYYTPYEGLNLDNQISRKLGHLTGSWRETTSYFIVILTYIRNKEAILLKLY